MSHPIVHIQKLYFSFGGVVLFKDLSFSIHKGETFALIGANGVGKSTFFKLLTRELLPESGSILHERGVEVGALPQVIEFSEGELTVEEYLSKDRFKRMEEEMERLLSDSSQLEKWEALHEQYESQGGYHQLPVEEIYKELDISQDLLEMSLKELSEGQKVRVVLAQRLKENPSLLLLDEPTNHLDQARIGWLSQILKERRGATIVISHDRKFLNSACNRLLELEEGQMRFYTGSYDAFLEEKKRFYNERVKLYSDQKERQKQLRSEIKARTFSKRKPSGPTDRNVMAYDRWGEKHQKSQQRQLTKMKAELEKLEENWMEKPPKNQLTALRFFEAEPIPPVLVEFEEVSKVYGEKQLFSGFNAILRRGERILLRGSNGAGKTTLLKCLIGKVSPDGGKIHLAHGAKIGYLSQNGDSFPDDLSPLEYFEEQYQLVEEEIRALAHQNCLGKADLLRRPFKTLSAGQRKRLALLCLKLETPNLLLLDEPTNHLDLLTLEALESALLEFEGAILAVSHDPTFIEKIRTDEWELESSAP